MAFAAESTGRAAALQSMAARTRVTMEPPAIRHDRAGTGRAAFHANRSIAGEPDPQRPVGIDRDGLRFQPEPDTGPLVGDGDLEPGPGGREVRIDEERVAGGTDPSEALCEGLPGTAHRGEMETARGRPVRSSRSSRAVRRSRATASSIRPARAKSAAWIPGESELPWAVRGS